MPSSNRRSSDEDKTRKYNMKNAKKTRTPTTTKRKDMKSTKRVPTQKTSKNFKGKK